MCWFDYAAPIPLTGSSQCRTSIVPNVTFTSNICHQILIFCFQWFPCVEIPCSPVRLPNKHFYSSFLVSLQVYVYKFTCIHINMHVCEEICVCVDMQVSKKPCAWTRKYAFGHRCEKINTCRGCLWINTCRLFLSGGFSSLH